MSIDHSPSFELENDHSSVESIKDSSEDQQVDLNSNDSHDENEVHSIISIDSVDENSNDLVDLSPISDEEDSDSILDTVDPLSTLIHESFYKNKSVDTTECYDKSIDMDLESESESIEGRNLDICLEIEIEFVSNDCENENTVNSSKSLTMMDDNEYLNLAHQKLPYFQSIAELESVGCQFRISLPII